MIYLVDTSAWVLALRADGDPKVAGEVSAAIESNQAATCPVVLLELLSGVKTERHYQELESELRALRFIPVEDATWTAAYRIGFTLRKKGVSSPAADILIAAAALETNCIVLHRDRHFDLMAKYTGLKTKKV